MAKLANTIIYGSANIAGTVMATGPNFDISAASGINLSSGNSISSIVLVNNGLNYQNVPSILIANSTTVFTGGVTANANALMKITSTFTLGNVGAGYANGDYLYSNTSNFVTSPVLANAVFQVTSNTDTTYGTGGINGLSLINPGLFFTMPQFMNSAGVLNTGDPRWIQITGTSGLGTGANVNVAVGGIQVSNAYFQTTGSGYVEQPTVTFSGGTPGTAASGFAFVGGQTIIKSLGTGVSTITGQSLMFQTPSGNSLLLRDPGQGPIDAHVMIVPTASGYAQVMAEGSNANASLYVGAKGAGNIRFSTNSTGIIEQMRVSHTASAVNYVQVTGAATGGSPQISVQGSDTAASLIFIAKGALDHRFATNTSATNVQFRVSHTPGTIVNYAAATGNIAGAAPSFFVAGTDADIDLTLTPKGVGAIRFGTLTATADAPITGYITIKDSGGTLRKLAVIT